MAALPELKVPVESHWPSVSTSWLAQPLSIMRFILASASRAPSVLTLV